MKRMKMLLVFLFSFAIIGIAQAESISMSNIITKFESDGKTVTQSTSGSGFTVSTGETSIVYTYSSSNNILSYNAGAGLSVNEVVRDDAVLGYIVDLSSNKAEYDNLKRSKTVTVTYGTGCDLTNMGFCYNDEDGTMSISLTNQFTSYLISQYSGTPSGDAAKNSADPVDADGEAVSSPDTGYFAEIGIIAGLVVLLLVVVSLKRRSETEFKI